jgi:AcrR family transcriptional regulator
MPRPAPDLDLRRDQISRVTREIARVDGWAAVTMRRVATEIGVSQPVLYSAFPGGRQALVDAVALGGFAELAGALESVSTDAGERLRTYLDFALTQPHVYEAMFTMPSGLQFGTGSGPEPLRRAFAAIQAAFGDSDDTTAEVAWATVHGLASLQISRRLPAERSEARLDYANRILTR